MAGYNERKVNMDTFGMAALHNPRRRGGYRGGGGGGGGGGRGRGKEDANGVGST